MIVRITRAKVGHRQANFAKYKALLVRALSLVLYDRGSQFLASCRQTPAALAASPSGYKVSFTNLRFRSARAVALPLAISLVLKPQAVPLSPENQRLGASGYYPALRRLRAKRSCRCCVSLVAIHACNQRYTFLTSRIHLPVLNQSSSKMRVRGA
jgi:hypothetical protein